MGNLDGRLTNLRSAAGSGDTAALRFAAHSLAGSRGDLGLVAAHEHLTAPELLADMHSGGTSAMLRAAAEEPSSGRSRLSTTRQPGNALRDSTIAAAGLTGCGERSAHSRYFGLGHPNCPLEGELYCVECRVQ